MVLKFFKHVVSFLSIVILETKIHQIFHEQAVRIKTKNKNLGMKCKKELKERRKQVEEHLDEKIENKCNEYRENNTIEVTEVTSADIKENFRWR